MYGISLVLAGCLLLVSFSGNAENVERWDFFELVLEGPSDGNPFKDVQVSAEFSQGSKSYRPDGFYDGDGIYKVRFMPGELGPWRYVTHSNRPELDGRRGEFNCVPALPGNHGPVGVHNTFELAYADGTPHLSWGTTCYAWAHQGDAMEEHTLDTLKTAPFNKMRMCVFPKDYSYNKNEPEYYVFPRERDENDYTRFSPEFFAHFEKRVGQLRDLGIEADLILFHPYDRWGYESMDDATDDYYLRYVIARLSAYRNVWWSLANEFDLMGDKEEKDWDRFFQIIVKHDPYGHLRGIHNCRRWYDHTKPWVTHASLQTSNFGDAQEYRERYQKPVIYDECKYEGNIPQGWGNISAEEMTHHFWAGTMAGCYVGHGETYEHPEDLLWWSKGGVLRGESPERIAFLRTIVDEAPFTEMKPDFDFSPGNHAMVKEKEYYLLFFENMRTQTLNLPGNTPYKVDGIDPWEMTVSPIGTASPGEFSFSAPKANYALRLTPYAHGEKLRPEAKAQASVTEGSVPLRVTFSTPSTLNRQWDFGNGETSSAASVTRVYEDVGVHTAKLTVTDEDGGSAVAMLTIATLPSVPEDLDAFTAWPGSTDGLRFLWESNSAGNQLPDGRKCRVEGREGAAFSADGAMDSNKGSFVAADIEEDLLNACKAANQLSIEAHITVSNTDQSGPARIVSFSNDSVTRNFTLGQEKEHLVLRLRTPNTGKNGLGSQQNLCPIKAGKAVHVIVSYFPGHTYCFVNGKEVLNTSEIQGDFSNWEPCHLLFGDEWDGNRHWAGLLDGVTIYNRFIGPKEAAKKYELFQAK